MLSPAKDIPGRAPIREVAERGWKGSYGEQCVKMVA
jgi:hypothetical protein